VVGFIWGRAVHAFSHHFFLFLAVLPCSQAWSAPTQQRFNDWQVTCNNQNFCVTRNVGLHYGLVMTLSRSAGAVLTPACVSNWAAPAIRWRRSRR
jgi:hypothetical protein